MLLGAYYTRSDLAEADDRDLMLTLKPPAKTGGLRVPFSKAFDQSVSSNLSIAIQYNAAIIFLIVLSI